MGFKEIAFYSATKSMHDNLFFSSSLEMTMANVMQVSGLWCRPQWQRIAKCLNLLLLRA